MGPKTTRDSAFQGLVAFAQLLKSLHYPVWDHFESRVLESKPEQLQLVSATKRLGALDPNGPSVRDVAPAGLPKRGKVWVIEFPNRLSDGFETYLHATTGEVLLVIELIEG